MPELTSEQKEHLKIAHRANMRIEETWSLFCMYLSQDKTPEDALEKSRQAVSVWADWMDENEVEPPDIPQPDYGQQMVDSMGKMFEKLPQAVKAAAPWPFRELIQPSSVDAQFVPAEQSDPAPQPAALEPTGAGSQQEPI